MFMVLFNFHLCSRSQKTTENTLSGSTKNKTLHDSKRVVSEESTKTNSQEREEKKARVEESVQAKESSKFEAEAKALAKTETKTKTENQLKELAQAREEGKAEALSESKSLAKTEENNKKKKEKKEKKKKIFQKKLDKEMKKKLSKMALCKPGEGEDDKDKDGKKIIGGTNVFDGKINATDALGIVGSTNWSINKPPYKVERCDQILLIHGKKLDLTDYCIKEDAFMTMSIYMVNFFTKKDSNKLLDSIPMDQITAIPSALAGAPGCTMWQTKTKSFSFCYENKKILDQVTQAYYDFLNCRKPSGPRIAYTFKNACDLSKMDLSAEGPFGQQGPLYKEIIDAMAPDAKKKEDLTGVNPYYIHDEIARVPGNVLHEPKPDPRLQVNQYK